MAEVKALENQKNKSQNDYGGDTSGGFTPMTAAVALGGK